MSASPVPPITCRHFAGDRVLVKLSDADWLPGVVLAREVTGFGTPAKRVSYYVRINGLNVTVTADNIKAA